MAIRTKPKQQIDTNEHQITALIEKGGTVAPKPDKHINPALVQLRLPRELIKQIDQVRNKRIVPPSRHSWIMEALLKQLKVEDQS